MASDEVHIQYVKQQPRACFMLCSSIYEPPVTAELVPAAPDTRCVLALEQELVGKVLGTPLRTPLKPSDYIVGPGMPFLHGTHTVVS